MPNPEDPYPEHWYKVVEDESLRQGDIFRDLPVFWLPPDLPAFEGDPTEDQLTLEAEWARGDWIIMTASCDLDQRRCDHALLAHVVEVTPEALNAPGDEDEAAKYEEVVRMGLHPAMFLLSETDDEDLESPFPRSIAYFRTHVLLPLEYLLRNVDGPRLRLRHPIREKFGNWVGERMSSVGPENYALIPRVTRVFPPHWARAVNAEEGPPEGWQAEEG